MKANGSEINSQIFRLLFRVGKVAVKKVGDKVSAKENRNSQDFEVSSFEIACSNATVLNDGKQAE